MEHLHGLAPPPPMLAAAGQLAELLVWLGHEADACTLQRALGEWAEASTVRKAIFNGLARMWPCNHLYTTYRFAQAGVVIHMLVIKVQMDK